MHTEFQTSVLNQLPCETMPLSLKQQQPADDLSIIHNLPVGEVMKRKLEARSTLKWESDQENAFFVADLGEVYRQHLRWKSLLPRIEPFFAIKSNPDPMVVKLLAALGLGFDCASKSEIQQVLQLGVDPERIIYANPCKQASFIRYAAQQHVAKMTFDNAEELHKIKLLYPNAELVLRILTDDSKSLCQLGLKFGAPMERVASLLQTAKDLELNVIGVSFHVGSGCLDENAFSDAVIRARKAFDIGQEMGFNFTLLDVGGGFPGADVQDGITFEKVAAVLGPAVDAMFPPEVRVIAEPGRYFVASAFSICTSVIGRRTIESEQGNQYMYYVNDGMYGSFNCILFDHQEVYPQVLSRGDSYQYGVKSTEPTFTCSVWGPTCDSIDCLAKETKLPLLEDGDWIYWENMGAYTICAASQFNGFRKSEVLYTNTYQ
ncbi:ornithine decarboxylase [Lichtheimia corymbifera JMRC:FSU:9682]|uniref:ornithine decarboxylase n=1 Tax=Lichtheimia corymbifera JMRC:FSU:9682 TaxID=1263082 RepID=A0A068SAW5_9FUNG|nr:ornithine decarboxylase [Lichtheimia corymbifera JMRC:FSU:9682]